jgi:prepilin-type N-terminal cleavage/methylation domain-containing protein
MRVNDDPSVLRRGFTLPEMLIVIVIIVLLAAMAAPATAKQLRRSRVNQAANVVAGDLENAVSSAARLRRPVRITRTTETSFTVTDRNTGALIQQRELGSDTEWKVTALGFSTATVDVFPNGVTSASLTVTVSENGYSRQVRLSRAGLGQVIQ